MQTNLTVEISHFTVDWLTVTRRLYNGRYPGPTFYWKQDDVVVMPLVIIYFFSF